ncbi:MAG: DUF6636 domain-containing protein [Gaiellaceae bacterium]|jgi:hypothetical protein
MTKRRISSTLAAICALGLIALLALATSATGGSSRSKDTYINFRMPSNNIFCAYIVSSSPYAKYLRCDIMSGLRPKPSSRGCVEGSRGISVDMNVTGRATYPCSSDTVYNPHAKKFPYGWIWRRGGFTCWSKMAGLRCRNLSGHGFFLSRAYSYRF